MNRKKYNIGKNNPFFGKHHTIKTKQIMSCLRKGKKLKELGHIKNCQCGVCKAKRINYWRI